VIDLGVWGEVARLYLEADAMYAESMARRLYEITLEILEERGDYSPLLMMAWEDLPQAQRELRTEVCRRLMLEGIPLPETDND